MRSVAKLVQLGEIDVSQGSVMQQMAVHQNSIWIACACNLLLTCSAGLRLIILFSGALFGQFQSKWVFDRSLQQLREAATLFIEGAMQKLASVQEEAGFEWHMGFLAALYFFAQYHHKCNGVFSLCSFIIFQ